MVPFALSKSIKIVQNSWTIIRCEPSHQIIYVIVVSFNFVQKIFLDNFEESSKRWQGYYSITDHRLRKEKGI